MLMELFCANNKRTFALYITQHERYLLQKFPTVSATLASEQAKQFRGPFSSDRLTTGR